MRPASLWCGWALLPALASGCVGPGTVQGKRETGVADSRDGSQADDSTGADLGGDDSSGADSARTDDSATGTDTDTAPPLPEELRGVWVDRWTFSDADDVARIMEGAASAGFNTVFFQIRGNADAYYRSTLEPWASRLSGALGQDPGWDPLAEAVTQGHLRGLEVHAYVNAFPFWAGTTPPVESVPRHALLAHPEWLVADGSGTPMALNSGYVWMSPGNPEVRQRLADVVEEIVAQYDVDGVHLDLIRYPGADYSHDAVSEALFPGGDWEGWQREQVVEAVRGVYAVSPVPVTAAVWGVYTNDWGWSSVSEGRDDYYQDSRAFLSEGVMDATIPMIYWPVTDVPGDRLDFATLIADHLTHTSGRHLYAGIDASLGKDDVLRCIEAARAAGSPGVVIFDYGLMEDGGWLQDLAAEAFSAPAAIPTYPWR